MYNLYNFEPNKDLLGVLRKKTRINANRQGAAYLKPWMVINTNKIGYQIAEILTVILIFAASFLWLFV